MRSVPARAALLGALFAALVTVPGLGTGTLWDNSETAYGEVAREILLSHDWVVMHLNGQEWFVQPPLYFWIAALLAKLFGPTAFALRLPSALATIAMGGTVGYATARIAGGRAGTVAAVVLSTSLMQAIVGRLAIMDALLDLTVAAAVLWWYRAFEPSGDARRRDTAFVCGALALAVGTLAKGPVAPVITVLVVGVWALWERRAGRLAAPRPGALALAALAFLVVTLPWFLALFARVGAGGIVELIGHYTVGRYTGVIENQRGPFWYYLPVLILGFFPWIAFVPVALASARREAAQRDGGFARLALVWTVVPLVFFSFASTKLPNYVALLLPALAILVALWFARVAAGAQRRAAVISAATVPLFVGCVGVAIALFSRSNRLDVDTAAARPAARVPGRRHAARLAADRRRAGPPQQRGLVALRAGRDQRGAGAVHRPRGRAGRRAAQADPAAGAADRRRAQARRRGRHPRRERGQRPDLLHRAAGARHLQQPGVSGRDLPGRHHLARHPPARRRVPDRHRAQPAAHRHRRRRHAGQPPARGAAANRRRRLPHHPSGPVERLELGLRRSRLFRVEALMQSGRFVIAALAGAALLVGAGTVVGAQTTAPATTAPLPAVMTMAPMPQPTTPGPVPAPSPVPDTTAPATAAPAPTAAPASTAPVPGSPSLAPVPVSPSLAPVHTMAPRPVPSGLANPPTSFALAARGLKAARTRTGYVVSGQAEVRDGCQAARFASSTLTIYPPQLNLVQYRRPTSMGMMCTQMVRWIAARSLPVTSTKPPPFVTVRTAAGVTRVPIR